MDGFDDNDLDGTLQKEKDLGKLLCCFDGTGK